MKRESVMTKAARRKAKRKCRMCGGTKFQTTEYTDAFLHICKKCRYPERVMK